MILPRERQYPQWSVTEMASSCGATRCKSMIYHRMSACIEFISFSSQHILPELWGGAAAVMDPGITPPNL